MSIRIAEADSKKTTEIEAYLPGNYKVLCTSDWDNKTYIVGEDNHGWTLDGYVIPRLASGLIACKEITEIFSIERKS